MIMTQCAINVQVDITNTQLHAVLLTRGDKISRDQTYALQSKAFTPFI